MLVEEKKDLLNEIMECVKLFSVEEQIHILELIQDIMPKYEIKQTQKKDKPLVIK